MSPSWGFYIYHNELFEGQIMKTYLIVSALALAATAVVSNANATQLNISGVAFHAYNGPEVASIDYLPGGVRTIATSPRYVIASVDHNPPGRTIYIDGYHYGSQTTSCTVYSYNDNTAFLGSMSVSASSVSGAWSRLITLSLAMSPNWAYYSVLCNIPANGNGVLYGVTDL
jgi:hypothetical protein